MTTVFDVLSPRTFTSCLKVSSYQLEMWACGNEISEDLEDAKDSMMISDAMTKFFLSDPKAKQKGVRITFLLSPNSLTSGDLVCLKHPFHYILFTTPPVQLISGCLTY